MIQSFEIKNFRCFEQLSLKDLSAINIIVGDNGSGKTTVLEALLLAAYAHPQVAQLIRIARKRTLPHGQISWSRDFFQSLWVDLFFSFDHSKPITAHFVDSKAGAFGVTVSYLQPETAPAFSIAAAIPPLVFTRHGPNEEAVKSLLKIDERGNPVWEGAIEQLPSVYVIPSTAQFIPQDMVEQFSEITKQNQEDCIIEAMKEDFPQILNISILKDGDEPALFATTNAPTSVKIPLAVVSSGAARYLNMLLAVTATKNGVVLIDEIENGLYWKKMPNIWKRLRTLCIKLGVQIFATTHSNECLQSLIEAMEGHEDDFSLIRTVMEDGLHETEHFHGKTFLAALRQHGEVR
jgi:AAA15 family ATPase/GTPase